MDVSWRGGTLSAALLSRLELAVVGVPSSLVNFLRPAVTSVACGNRNLRRGVPGTSDDVHL